MILYMYLLVFPSVGVSGSTELAGQFHILPAVSVCSLKLSPSWNPASLGGVSFY